MQTRVHYQKCLLWTFLLHFSYGRLGACTMQRIVLQCSGQYFLGTLVYTCTTNLKTVANQAHFMEPVLLAWDFTVCSATLQKLFRNGLSSMTNMKTWKFPKSPKIKHILLMEAQPHNLTTQNLLLTSSCQIQTHTLWSPSLDESELF